MCNTRARSGREKTIVTTALLVHHDKVPIPYYRIQNYKYLRSYLRQHGYDLHVFADGPATQESVGFPVGFVKMGFATLARLVNKIKPRACLLVVNHSQPYFFPLLVFLRLRGVRVVTWTHGTDLQRVSRLSAFVHHLEHELCDGIVLYAEHMRRYLLERHRRKAFVATNTLNLTEYQPRRT